jgi:hypothetical protein
MALEEPAHARAEISWNRADLVGNMRRDSPGTSGAARAGGVAPAQRLGKWA